MNTKNSERASGWIILFVSAGFTLWMADLVYHAYTATEWARVFVFAYLGLHGFVVSLWLFRGLCRCNPQVYALKMDLDILHHRIITCEETWSPAVVTRHRQAIRNALHRAVVAPRREQSRFFDCPTEADLNRQIGEEISHLSQLKTAVEKCITDLASFEALSSCQIQNFTQQLER